MGLWTAWSTVACKCPSKSKPGKKHRNRVVVVPPKYGGKECLDENEEKINLIPGKRKK